MAKNNIGSLMEKLQNAGLKASPEATKVVEEKRQEEAAPAAAPVGKLGDHDPRYLAFAAAGIQLLGANGFAKGLDRAVNWSSGADVSELMDRLDEAVDELSLIEGERLRSMMGEIARRRGVPSRAGELARVQAALPFVGEWVKQQRADERAASRLEVPEPTEGEDLDNYRTRLQTWAADKPGTQLKRIGFDAWQLVEAEGKRREAVKAAAAEVRKDAAIDELWNELAAASSIAERVQVAAAWRSTYQYPREFSWSEYGACDHAYSTAIGSTRAPWALWISLRGFGNYEPIRVDGLPAELTEEDRNTITDGDLLNAAVINGNTALISEVGRRWPVAEGSVRLVEMGIYNEMDHKPVRYVVEAGGQLARFNDRVDSIDRLFKAGTWALKPNAQGWWQRVEKEGVLCDPDVFAALARLEGATKGNCFISPSIAAAYGRHPKLGYPRLAFGVSAGRHYDGTDLPIWRPGTGTGPLVERFQDIALLRRNFVAVPENAWWMPITIGTTQAGKPRIDQARGNEPLATLVWFCEGAMSQGRWGWNRRITAPVKDSEKGGSRVLWQTWVSSSGGGVRRSAALLWVTKAGSIGLESGEAIGFNGDRVTRIAGGHVEAGDAPSRD
ncbi:MAG: hypothetical protein HYV32_01065 [Candidatus Kerfeldbacteria bacterium]|nr:hypothetical protein [Candidatus Kerfeldbacteria bacterium]